MFYDSIDDDPMYSHYLDAVFDTDDPKWTNFPYAYNKKWDVSSRAECSLDPRAPSELALIDSLGVYSRSRRKT